MTGRAYADVSDGIWDDGEFISWDWINGQLHRQERQAAFPNADQDLIEVFDELIDVAARYREVTGRHLPVFGELGEIYAELRHGLKRNRPNAPGSDGRIGNDHVEVKTITPEKKKQKIQVKRSGNFNKLIVVRISEDFEFESRIFERKRLGKGTGKFARVSWTSLDTLAVETRQQTP
ncbi:MAG: hypothetical protein QM741_16790 [Rudaea sp.]|uniref:hypothetical protein n=1 Tax=Rudaea sp. TaxID=2136325 RepID=UPI0039E2A32A